MRAEVLALKGAWPCPLSKEEVAVKKWWAAKGPGRCPIMDPLLTFYKRALKFSGSFLEL